MSGSWLDNCMNNTTAISPTAARDFARLTANAKAATDQEVLEVVARCERRKGLGAAQRRCLDVYRAEATARGIA